MKLIIISALFTLIGYGIGNYEPGATDSMECAKFEGTDAVCEMCDALELGEYTPRHDYKIDIFDRGDGSVILQDIKTGQAYVIQFDSLQQIIKQLNQ